ncbi:MAG TPA: HAD family hydrolase [Planctomycetota bacterium]|nr:HAD family hydrolase [Planctomycetota bacterium]
MVKAILFDLDGVLVDSYEVWFHLLNAVATRNRYAPITREQYKDSWGQGLEVDVKLYYTRHTVQQLRAEYDVLYPDYLHYMKVMDGAAATLKSITLPKAVITNSPVGLAKQALAAAKLDGYLDTVVGSDEVPHSKPAPDGILEACRRLGVKPAETIMIGDSRFDEGAAKAAGADFRWFTSFAALKL